MEQRNILFHIPRILINDGATRMVRDYISRTIHHTKVVSEDTNEDALPHYKWADVVLSHLGTTGLAANTCNELNKPLIYMAHNWNEVGYIKKDLQIGVINNSYHLPKYPNPSVVCHPMCVYEEGKSEGEYVTLINLNENKGGGILRRIANNMPDEKFLGIKGGYGKQIEQPKNVTVLSHTNDIRKVLEQTKILIMPSLKESWGRTAAEAIQMGVPVISTETEGVVECLGDACWYIEREDIEGWTDAIKRIRGEKSMMRMNQLMRRRLAYLIEQGNKDIETFNKFIIKIYKQWQSRQKLSKGSLRTKENQRMLTVA